MPEQSWTGMQVPLAADPYSFEQILGALADSARVIVPAANATAAAQVLTDATNAGFDASAASPVYVHRLDLDAVMLHDGTAWRRLTGKAASMPYAMAAGVQAYSMNSLTTRTYAVSFPPGRFTVAPIILPGPTQYSQLSVTVEAPSVSGFTLRVTNIDSTATTFSGDIGWTATQMTDTTAAG